MCQELKLCKKCNRELPLNTDYFFKKKCTKDGFTSRCKECEGYNFTEYLTKIAKEGYKFCIKCDRELLSDIRFFPPDKMCKGGFRNVCRECGKDGHFMDEDYIPKTWWSDEGEKLFIEVYPHYTNNELIRNFFPNETHKSLTDKAFRMGKINKTNEAMRRSHIEQSLKISGENNCNYGKHLSDETRSKISISRRKLNLKGENSYWFGKKRSEKQRIQISIRRKGKWSGNKNPRHMNPLNGEMNGRWKGGVKPIYLYLRDHIQDWKNKSMANCEYRCVLSGTHMDNIHHLHPFRDIVDEVFENLKIGIRETMGDYSDVELKNILDELHRLHDKYGLGVCLNKDIHKLFHDTYGYTNTNKQQFKEFSEYYKQGKYNDLLDCRLSSKIAKIRFKYNIKNINIDKEAKW